MNRSMSPREAPDITEVLGAKASPGWRRLSARRIGWFGAALGLVLLILRWVAHSEGTRIQYETRPAERGSLSVTVTATGNLEPINKVQVGSELSGTVRSVEVDYNDRVKQNQVLARLDTGKLRAQLLQSKAALESAQAKVLEAQATVGEARSNLARLQHLHALSNSRAVSEQDIEAAQAALARARAEEASCRAGVAQSRATLEANETDLYKAVIRSPIDGIVLTRSVEPGQTVAASLETPVMFTLAEDLSRMKLHVDVDEADVGAVKEGQEATFSVDAYPERRFPARILQVRYGAEEDDDDDKESDDGVVTYKALLNVDNSDMSLRPGMTATAEIIVKRIDDAILVPNAALRFTPGQLDTQESSQNDGIMSRLLPRPPEPPTKKPQDSKGSGRQSQVWVHRDGRIQAIPVTPGETDGISTVILEGSVDPGMPLVVDGTVVKP